MEQKVESKTKNTQLSIQAKSQLHFGIKFNEIISGLKVFIYGLRGVSINSLLLIL